MKKLVWIRNKGAVRQVARFKVVFVRMVSTAILIVLMNTDLVMFRFSTCREVVNIHLFPNVFRITLECVFLIFTGVDKFASRTSFVCDCFCIDFLFLSSIYSVIVSLSF